MSERYGLPDHAPRHDEPLQSTTPQGNWGKMDLHGGGHDIWSPSPTYGGDGGYTGPVGHVPSVPHVPTERSVWFAIALTAAIGPFGVFRAGFLHGAAALAFTWMVASPMARQISVASGGRLEPINVLYAMFWVTMIPWVVIALTARNRRIARRNATRAMP
jgi:hypothetical protein